MWTGQRLCKANVGESGCRFCDSGEVEDARHMWWRCPAWAGVREAHGLATSTYSAD